jgi:hypothetical protein
MSSDIDPWLSAQLLSAKGDALDAAFNERVMNITAALAPKKPTVSPRL